VLWAGVDPLADLVRVAEVRWAVEEALQQAKGEVRRWTAWYRTFVGRRR
jgi:hypothetical protein